MEKRLNIGYYKSYIQIFSAARNYFELINIIGIFEIRRSFVSLKRLMNKNYFSTVEENSLCIKYQLDKKWFFIVCFYITVSLMDKNFFKKRKYLFLFCWLLVLYLTNNFQIAPPDVARSIVERKFGIRGVGGWRWRRCSRII